MLMFFYRRGRNVWRRVAQCITLRDSAVKSIIEEENEPTQV